MFGRVKEGRVGYSRSGLSFLRITASAGWLFLLGCAVQIFSSTMAVAQSFGPERPIVFSIPAQPLARALVAYGAATGLDVFYDADLAEEQRSTEVVGSLHASEALQVLLLGTGYIARSTGPGALTILQTSRTLPAAQAIPAKTSLYRPYFAAIQARVSDALCRDLHTIAEQNEILFRFWLTPSGVVARTEIIADNGDLTEDQSLAAIMRGLAMGAPPVGMPQPVNLVVLPPSKSSSLCHSTLAGNGYRRESRPQ